MNTVETAQDNDSLDPADWLELYGDYLFRIAVSQVRSDVIAEDLVQETLISAIKAKDSFEGRSKVKTWLTRILKNKIIDHYRKNSRGEMLPSQELADETINRNFNTYGIWNTVLSNWAGDPDKSLEDKQFYSALTDCVEKLPDKNRSVLLMKVVQDVDSDEICKVLEISPSNLWVLLHRARSAMRDCIEKNWVKKT